MKRSTPSIRLEIAQRGEAVAQLVPRDPFLPDVRESSPFAALEEFGEYSDQLSAGLEEISRNLGRLDDAFQLGNFDEIEVRAREVAVLADHLGLRLVGQVAADVAYCAEGPSEASLAATLSRLMRLVAQALDFAAGPLRVY